jgi:hypothetical protein
VGSLVAINGPITVAFNQAVNPSSVRAQLLDIDGKVLTNAANVAQSLNVLSITPAQPLLAGKRYNLMLHATAATGAGSVPSAGSQVDITAPFFTQSPPGSRIDVVPGTVLTSFPPSNNGPITVTFELNQPIGVGFGNTNTLDCVAFYDVGGAGSPGFNNSPTVVFQGDWKTTTTSSPPANVVCHMPPGVAGNPGMNVTLLTPIESNNASTNQTVITGFTPRFSVTIGQAPQNGNFGPCMVVSPAPGQLPGCTPPGKGTVIHLVFSRQDPSTTVKHVDGTTVGDDIAITIVM